MQKNKLDASALMVSKVCLGSMTFGEQNTESQAHSQLDYALERGINFIDTAEMARRRDLKNFPWHRGHHAPCLDKVPTRQSFGRNLARDGARVPHERC